MALEKRIKDELASVNKVPEDRCEEYNKIYNETLLPLIQAACPITSENQP